MVKYGRLQKEVEIPEGVDLKVEGKKITVKGNLGTLTRDYGFAATTFELRDNILVINVNFPRKKEKALIGTIQSHVQNMIEGVTKGYQYKLKIVYSHFPIRIKPDMKKGLVGIENLYGGRKPRYAKIVGDTKVKVEEEDVLVEGINKEHVGQTSANIQELTRQRGKRRQSWKTFMDGVFVYEKGHMA